MDAGQGLPCRDWAGVLPTQTFLNSNLVFPENFVQLCPSILKLFMIFFNTNGLTDIHTNSIQNKSPNYPIWVWAEFLYPIFSTSHKTFSVTRFWKSLPFGQKFDKSLTIFEGLFSNWQNIEHIYAVNIQILSKKYTLVTVIILN